MSYTYDRSKTAYGYNTHWGPGDYDPPEEREIDPHWDEHQVAQALAGAVQEDLELSAQHVAAVSQDAMRLKIKSVTAQEKSAKLEDFSSSGRGRYREESWSWDLKYVVNADLELLGVGGKRLTAREVYDLLFDRTEFVSDCEEDGVSFSPIWEPWYDDLKIGYYGDKLKIHIRCEVSGSASGSWAADYDY